MNSVKAFENTPRHYQADAVYQKSIRMTAVNLCNFII